MNDNCNSTLMYAADHRTVLDYRLVAKTNTVESEDIIAGERQWVTVSLRY